MRSILGLTLALLLLAAAAQADDFTFGDGNLGLSLDKNFPNADHVNAFGTQTATINGIQLTVSAPAGSPNLLWFQGYGNSNNGGGNLNMGDQLLFTFDRQLTLDSGVFRFLTVGEGFSIQADGGAALLFAAPPGTVSNNFELIDLGGITGTSFLFTANRDASFRISQLNVTVPEPAGALLLGLAVAGLVIARRRRRA